MGRTASGPTVLQCAVLDDSMTLEQRVSRLEGAYEQVDRRLSDLNSAIESLRTDMRAEIGELRRDMDRKFTTLLFFVGGSWVTMMATMIGLFLAG